MNEETKLYLYMDERDRPFEKEEKIRPFSKEDEEFEKMLLKKYGIPFEDKANEDT